MNYEVKLRIIGVAGGSARLAGRTQITATIASRAGAASANGPAAALEVLSRAVVRSEARFVVFHCADTLNDGGEFGVDPERNSPPRSSEILTASKAGAVVITSEIAIEIIIDIGRTLSKRLVDV